MTFWVVIAILLGGSATIAVRYPQTIPNWRFQD